MEQTLDSTSPECNAATYTTAQRVRTEAPEADPSEPSAQIRQRVRLKRRCIDMKPWMNPSALWVM